MTLHPTFATILAPYSRAAAESVARARSRRWILEEYITLASEMQRAWGTARAAISTAMAATGAEGDLDGHLNDAMDALFGGAWRDLRKRADEEGLDPDRLSWPIEQGTAS